LIIIKIKCFVNVLLKIIFQTNLKGYSTYVPGCLEAACDTSAGFAGMNKGLAQQSPDPAKCG
jgi:hypothetical protein